MVVTVVQCRISSRTCSRSKPPAGLSLPFLVTDPSCVTWGDPDRGGDSSSVQDQLKNVQQIQATSQGAFAAILVVAAS